MATYEDRLQQYTENDEPTARRKFIADGIRKKFGEEFDFSGLSDQEVIQRHHERFGADMSRTDYAKKLLDTYGKGYTPPPAPSETLGDKAAQVGEVAKETAKGIVPFVVPEVGKGVLLKAGAKAVASKIPVAGQIGFLGGHAINEAVKQATVNQLEKTAAQLPASDVEQKTQEFYNKLLPGLTAKGYAPEDVMREARARAENISTGRALTSASIGEQVAQTQREIVTEPVKAATDAFFLGIGAPAIEGVVQKGLTKMGLTTAAKAVAPGAAKATSWLGNIASHMKTGAIVGAPGMALQEGVDSAVQAAADNKPLPEVAKELVQGGKRGAIAGAVGGAALGGVVGSLEAGLGAVARPLFKRAAAARYRASVAETEADEARLMGWRKRREELQRVETQALANKRTAIEKTAQNFNPYTAKLPIDGDPAEAATSIIQTAHGDEAAMSETGLRAASQIADRIRLYQDANAEVSRFGQRELPPAGEPAAAPQLGAPLNITERAGRPIVPEEINPLAERAPSAAPVEAPAPATPAPEPVPAPRPSEQAVEFKEVAAGDFRKQVKKALESIPRAAGSLAVHPMSYYTKPGVEMYLSPDKQTGYALVPRPEGGKELVSAFNMGEKGLGLAAVREAVARGATHLDAIKPLEKLYERAGFVTTRTEKNYIQGQPDVVYMEIPGAVEAPSAAATAINAAPPSQHVKLSEEGGAIHMERIGTPPGKDLEAAIGETIKHADRNQVPVVTRIAPVPGPKGGTIPVEKLVPWYEKHGFKVVESTNLPEGQMATATLRREPQPLPEKKIGMLEAQRVMMERATKAKPDAPSSENLTTPEAPIGPGRPHQLDLWADANIAAARERIATREKSFPEAERDKFRQAGFAGEKPQGYRDPTSYDWADFADRVQIGVNVIIKQGLNKTQWIETMVRELGNKFVNIAEKVYAEAVAAYHARRPTGNDEVRQIVSDYAAGAGLGRGAAFMGYPEVDPKFAGRVATAYQLLDNPKKDSPAWKDAEKSYEALNHEIALQYKAIKDAGFTIEHTSEDPYATSADMRADIAENRRLKAFKTPEDYSHPFMTREQNDTFRAVHDFFGHAAEGYEFGARGEDSAYRKHASTLSNAAVPALTTETRGQNSWVNYHVPEPKKYPPIDKELAADAEKMLLKLRNYDHNGFDEAGFLTPSGKIVDIGSDTHANLASNLLDEKKGALATLLDNGFVRLHRGNNYSEINVQATRPMNDAQKSAIEKFVRSQTRTRMYYDFGQFAHLAHTGYARSLEDLFKAHDAAFNPRPHQELSPKDRPFAEQKHGLLPAWTYDDVIKSRTERAPANKLSAGLISRGIRGDERQITTAAKTLARGVRPVKDPVKVRARFTADGNSAINEMMRVSPESANWYHDDIAKMHALTEKEIPELSNPGHQTLFDLLLAFTSPNTNVPQNYSNALGLMKDYLRTGKVPFLRRFGQETNITSRSWVTRLNNLIEKNNGNLDSLRDFLLTKDPKTGVYNVEKEFGDKVGPFTLNIQGIHDQITVDVWMVRRLRRIAGTLYRDGKLNENWVPSATERRDIEESIRELSAQTGLDPDAVQAVLWDNEKMLWEKAGLSAPRIPFSVAAEGVIRNMHAQAYKIEQAHTQHTLGF